MCVIPGNPDDSTTENVSADLHTATQAMRYAGVRRLMVISGESAWVGEQARTLRDALCQAFPQDSAGGLWMGGSEPDSLTCSKARSLLGQEFGHAIFDARSGFDVEALAILAGTLRAGSWLLLLTPPWPHWPQWPDTDSLRWSEQPTAIATPHFIAHFQRELLADPERVLWRQGEPLVLPPSAARSPWQPPTGAATAQQQAILSQLHQAAPGVYVVTAPRGRGKSTLAGMLAQQSPGQCWVTSPARASAAQLLPLSAHHTKFWAPDALLVHCQSQPLPALDWLLIDEAAAIPTSLLQALVGYFPRILMTTTVQGYEGTGRGFLLKFCAALPHGRVFSLSDPLRWAVNDPLERLLDTALLFQDDVESTGSRTEENRPLTVQREATSGWLTQPQRLRQSYALLCSAHYRTSPLDLRRLLDAPGMHFYCANRGDALSGVAWWVEEGGLTPDLAHDIWAGRRRPRGSLVAQSLAAHGDEWQAPCWRSRRISRIAVAAADRRQGIGKALILCQQREAQVAGVDFLSVSFGYQPALWAFWQSCGFRLVRIGSHREASSGCYSAMALLPLSEIGFALAARAERKLARDWPALQRLIPLTLPEGGSLTATQDLNADDWRVLAGFAFAHRAMEPTFAALSRLLTQVTLLLPALRQLLHDPLSLEPLPLESDAAPQNGKKARMQDWRTETAQALTSIDRQRCEQWRNWVLMGGALPEEMPD